MAYLIVVLITLLLLAGFVVMTQYEVRRTARFFASERAQFDATIERITFIVEHVDLGAFVQDEIRRALHQAGHALVALSLTAVRAVERLLTRLVRYFRMRNESVVAPRESAREFVKTLSDFKDTLQATHPDVSELE